MPSSHHRKISFADLERTFRAAGPMVAPQNPHQAQPTAAQLQAQHQEALRRQEVARRLSRKPTDRDIPSDELADVIVGDGVERYKKLRDAERRLDSVMTRKRLDVVENLQRRYTRREGVLRLWISNTAEGQIWQTIEEGTGLNEDGTFEFEESSQATYRMKIEGRLLDDELVGDHNTEEEKEKDEEVEAEEKTANEARSLQQRPRFSHFFKAITVDFSRNPGQQPDGYSAIEWRKPQAGPHNPTLNPSSSEANFDTLEFERKSDENMNVVINLVQDEKSERFRLSPQLAEILDTEEEDRAGAVQGIWEYCRAMGLQEDEDKRSIVCDAALSKLFNRENVYFPHVPDLLIPHLLPAPPIQLRYTIRVDKQYIRGSNGVPASQPTIYDIRVPLPNPLIRQLSRFHTSKRHIQDLQQIVQTDEDLALLVQKLHHTNAKRKFHENLAKDPANFVRRWVSSQKRDLEVVLAEATRGGSEDAGGDEWRRGGETGVWGSQLAQESVGLWLARGVART
nr:swi/snf and rsc complexes subunit ssr3 [Quercus suber]